MHGFQTTGLRVVRFVIVLVSTMSVAPMHAQVLNETQKFKVDESVKLEFFGSDVDIDGELIAVGRLTDKGISGSGAVYLYNSDTYELVRKISLFEMGWGWYFGFRLDLCGDRIAISAIAGAVGNRRPGTAYIFNAVTGELLYSFAYPYTHNWVDYGTAVAMSERYLAVSAVTHVNGYNSGSVFVYDLDGADPTSHVYELQPDVLERDDYFGNAMAIEGDYLVVGCSRFGNHSGERDRGAVFVYSLSTGEEIYRLIPEHLGEYAYFGADVAVNGGVLAVGADYNQDHTDNFGAVYIYELADGMLDDIIYPRVPGEVGFFGFSVDISDEYIVVGLPQDDVNGRYSGSAELFDANTHAFIARLIPSDGMEDAKMGNQIALSQGKVVVAAEHDSELGFRSGAAYVFNGVDSVCTADINHDGVLTPTDFTAWIGAFNSSTAECDQNGDGVCIPTDFTAWISNYNAGCP